MSVTPESPRPAAPGRPRLIQLDILRGVAVSMILLNHQPVVPGAGPGLVNTLVTPVIVGLWTGVDLFFVLSGYLIGGLLISELRKSGRIDVKRFWIRRGFKIWPSYYLYVAVLAILTTLFYIDPRVPGAAAQGLLVNSVKLVYLQNYFPSTRLPYTTHSLGNHTWTLAVEEHFYILLPIVLVAASRYWRAVLPAVVFTLMVACLALRLRHYGRPMDYIWDYEVTHKRIDSLFFGVFLSYLSFERPGFVAFVARHRGLFALAGLALIAPMFVMGLGASFVKTFGYTCLALGYGCLLLAFVATVPGAGLSGRAMESRPARALAWVGFWSYSIYLWHFDLVHLANHLASTIPGPAASSRGVGWLAAFPWRDFWIIAYTAASIGLGVLIGHVVERPMLAWRDRLYPSRTGNVFATEPKV